MQTTQAIRGIHHTRREVGVEVTITNTSRRCSHLIRAADQADTQGTAVVPDSWNTKDPEALTNVDLTEITGNRDLGHAAAEIRIGITRRYVCIHLEVTRYFQAILSGSVDVGLQRSRVKACGDGKRVFVRWIVVVAKYREDWNVTVESRFPTAVGFERGISICRRSKRSGNHRNPGRQRRQFERLNIRAVFVFDHDSFLLLFEIFWPISTSSRWNLK